MPSPPRRLRQGRGYRKGPDAAVNQGESYGLRKELIDLGRVGYKIGKGGTVTQLTSKSTGVTLNKHCGAITTSNAALNAGTEVSFSVTNNKVGVNDCILVNHARGGTAGAYIAEAHSIALGSFAIMLGNVTAGNLSEALVLNYVVVKGADS